MSPPLPDPVESELVRLLDGHEDDFWPGVARLCQQHPDRAKAIHREAERLQAAAEGKRPAGSTQAKPPPRDEDAELKQGDRVGAFTVLDEIGHGGMGSVYLAEQKEPVRRRVALKVIKLGVDTKAVLARFEAERQALAMMDHSHIAARDGRGVGADLKIPFTTRASIPTDPPRLVSSVPQAGAEVTPTATFQLDFDRPLATASVGPASIFVRPVGGTPLGGSHQLTSDGRRVVLTNPVALDAGPHELVVTQGLQSAGNAPFPREAIVPFRVIDGFFAIGVEPAASARVGVGVQRVRVEFNREARLRSSHGVRLIHGGAQVSASGRSSGRTIDLLFAPLTEEGEYEVIADDVVDPPQNLISSPFRSRFTVDARETGWTVPVELPLQGLHSYSGGGFAYDVAANGRAAMVWTERDRGGPQSNAFASIRDGTTWSTPFLLEDTLNNVASPQISINEAGDVLATWTELQGSQFEGRARQFRSGQWGVTQPLPTMAIPNFAHVVGNGDAGVLALTRRQDSLLAATSLGGSFSAAAPLFSDAVVQIHPTDAGRWQADDAGRRVVAYAVTLRNGLGLYVNGCVPGGWTAPARAFDGYAALQHEYVTPNGDSVFVFVGSNATTAGRFAWTWRSGEPVGTPQWLDDGQSADFACLSGRSGDTIYVTTKVDSGRTRAHARLLKMSMGRFDDGRFVDDLDVTSTTDLRLYGSPDTHASLYFERGRQTGSYTAKCTWDAATGIFLPYARTTDVVPVAVTTAHDRDGNCVIDGLGGAQRFVPGTGFSGTRVNPFGVGTPIARVVTRHGRIVVIALRTEQRGAEQYEFLRVNEFR